MDNDGMLPKILPHFVNFQAPGCQNRNNYNGLIKKGPLNTLSTSRFYSQAVNAKFTAAKYCP